MSVRNVKRFLAQSEVDNSVATELLDEWKGMLEQDLDIQGRKFEYASLFGKLVMEWMQNPNDAVKQPNALRHNTESVSTDSDDDSISSSESFEQIGRKEMHEQRQEWEKYALNELPRDQEAIDKYLKDLFSFERTTKKIVQTPLHKLQIEMGKFDEMEPKRFSEGTVKMCINGIIKADIFSGEKREALVDLRNRPTILKEMSDVLNIDLESNLGEWKWEPSPVPLTMRRHLNGKYRVYMDEEIHQAILLHFIGAKWCVHMKQAFTSFFHSGAWTSSPFQVMDKTSRKRREYFLGESEEPSRKLNANANTVKGQRRQMYANDFFMTQLSSTLEGGSRDYGDDTRGNDLDLISYADDSPLSNSKTPLEIKESMHRLATTEMLLNKKIYGEFTIIQSDFKWFGPSLPHDSIFAVLKFLGVKGKWLDFFRKFLQVPVFWAQDGQVSPNDFSVRKRGIPISHAISDALGEAVMFCLDFAVSKKTGGSDLYRFHDDLFFWGQESVCIEAWKAINEFSDMIGLELNEEKTGSVQLFENPADARPLPKELPKGDIAWGFLRLDAKEGSWVIDDAKVDEHIVELKRQLNACRSVFAWIQAWNTYACRFFATNMGQPAACFGVEHVNMIIKTFAKIQSSLFDSGNGKVTGHLRKLVQERFGVSDVPDGFFYFPLCLGGLELRNPFISAFALRDAVPKLPSQILLKAFELDEDAYDKAKRVFDSGDYIPFPKPGGYQPEDSDDEFFSLEEYSKFREETSTVLSHAYTQLLSVPVPDSVDQTIPSKSDSEREDQAADMRYGKMEQNSLIKVALEKLKGDQEYVDAMAVLKGGAWYTMDVYWRWVFELYGKEMVGLFGGLGVGEKGMLPLGLVEMLRSERTRWLG